MPMPCIYLFRHYNTRTNHIFAGWAAGSILYSIMVSMESTNGFIGIWDNLLRNSLHPVKADLAAVFLHSQKMNIKSHSKVYPVDRNFCK